MDDYFSNLIASLLAFLPTLLAALVVLIIGWGASVLLVATCSDATLDDRMARMLQGGEDPGRRVSG
jgi:hypothetical protein